MKKHNAFIIQFLKTNGHPELIPVWCSNENQEKFNKLRVLNEQSEKRRCSCYILYCIDRRPELKKEYPCYPNTQITALLAKEWRDHRDKQDEVYKKYKLKDKKQVFLKSHWEGIKLKYPNLSENEITKLLDKMFKLENEVQQEE